jgi:BirA family biotin operon repressor/biotin-[acetyl-CoA-carboxylase] ligase
MVGGRKLAGLLVESAHTSGDRVRKAVLGIGLNVGLSEADLPPELVGVATSLVMEGRSIPRIEVLRATLRALEGCLEQYERAGIEGFRERWRGLSSTLGREVNIASAVDSNEAAFTGVVTDLAPSGALLLEDAAGGTREIWYGDVTLRHTDPA